MNDNDLKKEFELAVSRKTKLINDLIYETYAHRYQTVDLGYTVEIILTPLVDLHNIVSFFLQHVLCGGYTNL